MREFFSMGVVVSALELLQNGGEFILLGIWGILSGSMQHAEYFEVYAGRRHLREARRGACFGR